MRFVFPALAVALSAAGSGASAASPPLIWQGVETVGVQCMVQANDGAARPAMAAAICARIAALASDGTRLPVRVIAPGDPALIAPGTAALLFHASLTDHAGGQIMAFTVRPWRASAGQPAVLFGARPRAAIVPTGGDPVAAIEAGLRAALHEILPWQARPNAARPIEG